MMAGETCHTIKLYLSGLLDLNALVQYKLHAVPIQIIWFVTITIVTILIMWTNQQNGIEQLISFQLF